MIQFIDESTINNDDEVEALNTREAVDGYYVVVKEDTLSGIAYSFNINLDKLKEINHIPKHSDKIMIGQKIRIDYQVIREDNIKTENTERERRKAINGVYVVSSGDTLGGIAYDFKLNVEQLKKWNGLKNDSIGIGQKLILSKPNEPERKLTKKQANEIKATVENLHGNQGKTCLVSFYDESWNGRTTRYGEKFNTEEMTCANNKYPYNTILLITNTKNGKQVKVRVTDTGGFDKKKYNKDGLSRFVDITKRAMRELGGVKDGLIVCRVEVYSMPKNGKMASNGTSKKNR